MARAKNDYLWKNLRASKYGGVDVVGFREAPSSSVLAGQTLLHFIDNYDTEEEARAAHPDAKEYTSKWTAPQVSVNHLSDEGDLY